MWNGDITKISLNNFATHNSHGSLWYKSKQYENEYNFGDQLAPVFVDFEYFSFVKDDWGPMEIVNNYMDLYKNHYCMYASSDILSTGSVFDPYYYVYLCKLFDQTKVNSDEVIADLNKTTYEKSSYYYFSIFLENDYGYDLDSMSLYSEQLIGPFNNYQNCKKSLNYAIEHNIPARQCRTWESYIKYETSKYNAENDSN